MIAAYAEMNHLLGRTKGKLARTVWGECADETVRCSRLYEATWTGFTDGLCDDPEVDPRPGLDVTRDFQDAVDGLRAALDVMKRESGHIGMVSWWLGPYQHR
jgi:hypothetical protein